jgi:hypothetical protein
MHRNIYMIITLTVVLVIEPAALAADALTSVIWGATGSVSFVRG